MELAQKLELKTEFTFRTQIMWNRLLFTELSKQLFIAFECYEENPTTLELNKLLIHASTLSKVLKSNLISDIETELKNT